MKKVLKIIGIILIIIVIVALILIGIDYFRVRNGEKPILESMSPTIKAVVVEANEKSMIVMGIEGESGLLSSGFGKNGNIGFKQGQEILIYFNGDIMTTYPAQIGNVEKIEILKEKSDIEIPTTYLRYCYSSEHNVKVTVNELTTVGMTLSVVDTNELPYEYTTRYKINKKVKNEEYTGKGEKIGEDTEHSTSGYTRNRT